MAIPSVSQDSNVSPPRRGKIWAAAVDATVRIYDLSTLAMHGIAWNGADNCVWIYLTLQADGGKIYYAFDAAGVSTMSDTAAQTATSAPAAYAVTYAAMIPDGGSTDVRINRVTDRYLALKTASSTATLRLWASSQLSTSGG